MITLTCPKCAKPHPLSDDDAYNFYPRFFCLACGTKMEIPLKPEDLLRESRNPDRDRRAFSNGQKR